MREKFQRKITVAGALIFSFIFVSCSTTSNEKTDAKMPAPAPVERSKEGAPELDARVGQVWIVRPDGSKSCGLKKGMTPKAAAQELEAAGVKVFKQRMGHDGQMRMMVCGADTGNQTELLIDGQGLPAASKKGFRVKGEE